MWTLVIVSVLTIDPFRVQSDPLVTTATVKDCEYLADTLSRYNFNAQFLCVNQPTQGEK